MHDWIVYGQTTMATGSAIDNPTPNVNGLNGEVTSLPYIVPAGYNLVLTAWGFEGLAEEYGVCIPWIGKAPISNAKCLASVGPSSGSYYATGMRWSLPTGTILNIRLLNPTSENGIVCAWMCQGQLEAIS